MFRLRSIPNLSYQAQQSHQLPPPRLGLARPAVLPAAGFRARRDPVDVHRLVHKRRGAARGHVALVHLQPRELLAHLFPQEGFVKAAVLGGAVLNHPADAAPLPTRQPQGRGARQLLSHYHDREGRRLRDVGGRVGEGEEHGARVVEAAGAGDATVWLFLGGGVGLIWLVVCVLCTPHLHRSAPHYARTGRGRLQPCTGGPTCGRNSPPS